jgi:O-antigen/teichoic acid export membrane protein
LGTWLLTDPILNVLKISPALRADARFTFMLTVAATWFSMGLSPFQAVLEGMQRHDLIRVVDFVTNLIETILIFVFLKLHYGLAGLALAYAIRLVFSVAVFAVLAGRYAPQFKLRLHFPRRDDIKELISFGGVVQGMGCLFLVICSIDRFVLTSVAGLASTGLYELARKLISFTATLPYQISGPMIPAAADLAARSSDGIALVGTLIQKINRIIALILAPLLIFLSAFAQPILVGWLGHGESTAARMMWALSIGAYIHLLTGGVTATLRGLERTRSELSYAVLWLVLGVVCMPLCGWLWGAVGVAVGSSLAQIGACVLLMKLSAAELRFDIREWARNAFTPVFALLPLALVAALAWPVLRWPENRLNAAIFVGAAAVYFFGTTGIVYWSLFLNPGERGHIRRFVGKIGGFAAPIAHEELTHVTAD